MGLRLDRAECKGKDVLSAVVLVRICRHATCDVAIFFLQPTKSTGANRSFFAFEKLPIKVEFVR